MTKFQLVYNGNECFPVAKMVIHQLGTTTQPKLWIKERGTNLKVERQQ